MRHLLVLSLGLGLVAPSSAPAPPSAVVVATARGESSIPVLSDEGHPALAAEALGRLLPVTVEVEGVWAQVGFAEVPFRFLLGAPVVVQDGRVMPLAGAAYVARDSLFVPLEWLTDVVPQMFSEAYHYDAAAARFEEAGFQPVPPVVAGPRVRPPSQLARRNGFRMEHLVVVDPGHGGTDPGTPGRYLPRGMQEKHVNLAIGKLVHDELVRRGVEVRMTRTADTLIGLFDRAPMCHDECDLFVSVHVNSMPRRPGSERVNGVQVYYLGAEATEESRRVAQMENSALRYETGGVAIDADDPLEFIFKDLHLNEYLRESAQLADLVQRRAARVNPGENGGVAQNPMLAVLRGARRPAILVETGFATNREDAAFLASESGQQRLARAIADGVVEYLQRYERKVLPQVQP